MGPRRQRRSTVQVEPPWTVQGSLSLLLNLGLVYCAVSVRGHAGSDDAGWIPREGHVDGQGSAAAFWSLTHVAVNAAGTFALAVDQGGLGYVRRIHIASGVVPRLRVEQGL